MLVSIHNDSGYYLSDFIQNRAVTIGEGVIVLDQNYERKRYYSRLASVATSTQEFPLEISSAEIKYLGDDVKYLKKRRALQPCLNL